MFLPPEQRHPGSSPWQPPAKPAPPSRRETVILWLVGLVLASAFLAPMGGSSVIEALWFVLRH